MTPLRQRMLEELQLRNLSETTIHTYWRLVERCAKHFGASPAKLGPDHVRRLPAPSAEGQEGQSGLPFRGTAAHASSSTSEFSNKPGVTRRLPLPKGDPGCPP
jgi:hypothetical protein